MKKIARGLIAAAFWLAVWTLAAWRVGQEVILPSPASVGRTLLRLMAEAAFWRAAMTSLLRVMEGLLWGLLAGTAAGALMASWTAAEMLLSPLVRTVRATPVVSFIILVLLWIGKDRVPVLIAALMVFPVVAESLRAALREVDPLLLEMGKSYRFGFWKRLRLILVPSVLPAWGAAAVNSMGLAWKSGIAAEVLSQPRRAIGTELQGARVTLETPQLFAWTAVVILFSFLIEGAFQWALGQWRKRHED